MSVMLPWLVGEGIIAYRDVVKNKRPPLPAELLGVSGLFILLGLLDDSQPQLATLLAWGVDIAAFMNLFVNPPKASATTTTTSNAATAAAGGAAGSANSTTTSAASGTSIAQINNGSKAN